MMQWLKNPKVYTKLLGGAVAVLTFFLSDAVLPDDKPWWTHWALAFASLISYTIGVLISLMHMREEFGSITEREKSKVDSITASRDAERAKALQLAQRMEACSNLKSELDTARNELDVAQAELDEYRNELDAAHNERDELQAELDSLRNEDADRILKLNCAQHGIIDAILRAEASGGHYDRIMNDDLSFLVKNKVVTYGSSAFTIRMSLRPFFERYADAVHEIANGTNDDRLRIAEMVRKGTYTEEHSGGGNL